MQRQTDCMHQHRSSETPRISTNEQLPENSEGNKKWYSNRTSGHSG